MFRFCFCFVFSEKEKRRKKNRIKEETHIFANNGTKTRNPEQTDAGNLVDEPALAAEHGLADALALVVGVDSLRVGHVGVLPHRPCLLARQPEAGHVAEHGRREEHLSGARERGLGELGAGHELLHAKLDRSPQGDGRRHGKERTWALLAKHAFVLTWVRPFFFFFWSLLEEKK